MKEQTSVFLVDRDAALLERAVDTLGETEGRLVWAYADITDVDAIKSAVGHARETIGPINALVNNAGVILNIASTHACTIIPHTFPYPMAKHALLGLTKSLGLEYARRTFA